MCPTRPTAFLKGSSSLLKNYQKMKGICNIGIVLEFMLRILVSTTYQFKVLTSTKAKYFLNLHLYLLFVILYIITFNVLPARSSRRFLPYGTTARPGNKKNMRKKNWFVCRILFLFFFLCPLSLRIFLHTFFSDMLFNIINVLSTQPYY